MSDPFGTVKNTIRLRGGTYLDLLDPKPEQFTIEDIAGALSKICRFGGQLIGSTWYSVAEHCIHCVDQGMRDGLGVEVAKALLLHDATESFIGDCVKPLKVMLPEYVVVEKRLEKVIADKFNVDFDNPAIKEIDHAMLIAERKALFPADGVTWAGENEVRELSLFMPLYWPSQAERHYLYYADLFGIKG